MPTGRNALRRFSEDVDLYVVVPGHNPNIRLPYDLRDDVTRNLQAHIEQALAGLPGFTHTHTLAVRYGGSVPAAHDVRLRAPL